MNKLSQQEYYDSLPKRPMGSNVLFFNEKNQLLLVKPNYKPYWLLPGGTVDADESPRQAVIRETKEEIGLDIETAELLVVDYFTSPEGDSVKFMFDGGRLSEEQVKEIVLPEDELEDFKFVSIDEAMTLLGENMRRRIPHCLEAISHNDAMYLENGQRI